ncbi:MAG: winged helix-turn-helix domain-containing protein [Candidatus Ancillula trichonymphae]|nr:winged helix-turn-helix domain-containing protein [Candidatus Ancillula trichonymphae]
MYFSGGDAYLDGKNLKLSARLVKLLEYFTNNSGIYLSRREIEDTLYGYDGHSDSKATDTSISRIRKELERANPQYKDCIRARRNVGWFFLEPDTEQSAEAPNVPENELLVRA